jgi:hypothetical protein
MSLTQIGIVLAGIWLILTGIEAELTKTITLIFGIAIVVLIVLDSSLVRSYRTGNNA